MTYKIIQGKKPIIYRDDSIKKEYRKNKTERSHLLIQIISMNHEMPHTHVLKMALEYGKSNSKKTFENLLNELEQTGHLKSIKKGGSVNAPRLWEIPIPDFPGVKEFKETVKELLIEFENSVKELENTLEKMTQHDKVIAITSLLQSISTTNFLDRFYSVYTDLSSEMKKLKILESKIMILSFEVDFQTLMKSIGKESEIFADKFRKILDKYNK